MICVYIRNPKSCNILSAKMTVKTITLDIFYEEGELRMLVKIKRGGYEGTFLLDQHGVVLQAIQILNPS